MATERIQIIVTESGSRVVRRNIRGIGNDARKSSAGVGALRGALLGVGSGLVVRQFAQVSDALTQVQNRLGLVTSSSEELVAVTEELFKVSNDTRSSFEATAEVYARTALSAKNLGITQRETLDFTKALNQAIILSGASAQEARNGLIQFSQGLASNRLAGDELRAVLEQLPLVADIISRQLGVTRGALRELAAQGKITAKDIIDAFGTETQKELQQQFEATTVTISQSLTVLENALVRFTGGLNSTTGLAGSLADGILFLSENFDTFGRIVLAGIVTAAIFGVIAALSALTAVIVANPIGALTVGLVAASAALVAFSDEIIVSSDGLTTLRDVGLSVLEEFSVAFGDFADIATNVVGGFLESLGAITSGTELTFSEVLTGAAVFADRFVGVFVGIGSALAVVFNQPGAVLKATFVGITNTIIDGVELMSDTVASVLFGIGKSFGVFGQQLGIALIQIDNALTQLAAGNFSLAGDAIKEAVFQIENGTKRLVTGFGDSISSEFDRLRGENVFARIEGEDLNEAKKTGQQIADAFVEGFEGTTGVQDLIGRALTKAGDSAAGRAAEEANKVAGDLNKGFGTDTSGRLSIQQVAIQGVIDKLERRNTVTRESIGISVQEAAVRSRLLKIEEQLRRKGVELNDAQRATIQGALEQNAALETQADIFDRLTGAASGARFEMEQLQTLFESGRISVSQFREEFRNLRINELENSRGVTEGFERGFLKVQQSMNDFATAAESTLTNAFQGAEDAIVGFVQTGKFNFKSLADSILADLTRLLAKQALSGLLGGLTGGGSGFAGGIASFLLGSGKQAGGPVSGGAPVLVGERGPEIFTPPSNGNIIPNSQVAQEAPQVNVSVINVRDPKEITAEMGSTEGQKVILNVINNNPRAARNGA